MNQIARLKINLIKMPRPVWRRIEVPVETRLDDLHLVVQDAMGWENCHLYDFSIGTQIHYSDIDPNDPFAFGEDAAEITFGEFCSMLPPSLTFEYTYDFGDTWIHKIKVEDVQVADPNTVYPRLIKAVRRCPPEDCGGPWGYADFLKAIADPDNEEREELLEWYGEDFDPETVDVEYIQKAMARTAKRLAKRSRKPKKKE